jgi:hypothetical protein
MDNSSTAAICFAVFGALSAAQQILTAASSIIDMSLPVMKTGCKTRTTKKILWMNLYQSASIHLEAQGIMIASKQ